MSKGKLLGVINIDDIEGLIININPTFNQLAIIYNETDLNRDLPIIVDVAEFDGELKDVESFYYLHSIQEYENCISLSVSNYLVGDFKIKQQ